MGPDAITGLVASVLGIGGTSIAVIRWLHHRFEKSIIKDVMAGVSAELKVVNKEVQNNGGTSMKDDTQATRRELAEFKTDITARFDKVDEHLARQDTRIDGLYTAKVNS